MYHHMLELADDNDFVRVRAVVPPRHGNQALTEAISRVDGKYKAPAMLGVARILGIKGYLTRLLFAFMTK